MNPALDNDDFEFVELANIGSNAINLAGMTFGSGIDMTFDDARLDPHEFAVVVRNIDAFLLRYGSNVRVLGEYSGKLSNNGEQLSLRTPNAADDLIAIEYDDNSLWPKAADGVGATLEHINPGMSLEYFNKYYSWQPSAIPNGTPENPIRQDSAL